MSENMGLSRQEAIRQLHTSSRLFRQMCQRYQEQIGPIQETVSPEQMAVLGKVLAMRAAGTPESSILQAIAGPPTAQAEKQEGAIEVEIAAAEAAPALPQIAPDTLDSMQEVELIERLHTLSTVIERAEERREQDRDRMLTALMRTQQEISHLRYELAAKTGRKSRKQGLLQRLLG